MATQQKVYSIKVEGLDVLIKNADDAQKALLALDAELAQIKADLAKIPAGTPEFAALEAQQMNIEAAITLTKAALKSFGDDLGSVGEQATKAGNAAALFRELGLDIGLAGETVGDLEAKLESMNDELKNTEFGSQEFLDLNAAIEGTVKKLEAGRKFGEAFALGFKKVGDATNTVEGLTVAITAFEAAYSQATDEVQRAEITKAIFQAEEQLIELQTTARAGVFPEGSIGRLESEVAGLQQKIKSIPQGSQAFTEVKKQIDEMERALSLANTSLRDQKQILRDVGTSAVNLATGAAGLFASMAQGSEEAEKALLILQQAMTIIGIVEQANAFIRQAADAAAIAGAQARTVATVESTVAAEANAVATTEQAAASTLVAGASTEQAVATTAAATATGTATSVTGGLVKVLRVLYVTLLANPVLLIVGAVVALGAALLEASKRFKPLADAANTIEDAFGGVGGAIKALTKNFDLIIDTVVQLGEAIFAYVVAPVNAVIAAFEALRSGENPFTAVLGEVQKVADEFADVADAAGAVGDAIADGFKKGFDKSRALRELDAREAANSFRKQAADIAEAQLGGSRATEDARRAIRLEGLKEDRDIAAERLKIENDLTDSELEIIRSGNAEKIRELRKLFDARGKAAGDFDKILEGFSKVAAAETAVLQEQNAAFLEYINDRVKAIDGDLKLQQTRLAAVQNFATQELALEKEKAAALAKLDLARQAGELKGLEFQTQRLDILADFANKEAALAEARAQNARELDATVRQGTVDNLTFELEERRRLGTLTLQEETRRINEIAALKRQDIDAELAAITERNQKADALADEARKQGDERRAQAIEQGNAEDLKRAAELENAKRALSRETFTQQVEANAAAIEKQAAARRHLLELEAQSIELAQKLEGVDNTQATAELEAQSEELQRQGQYITSNKGLAENLEKTLATQTAQYDLQREIIRDNLDLETQRLDNEIKVAQLQIETNAANIAAGVGNIEQLKQENALLEQQIKLKEATKTEIKAAAVIEIGKIDTQEVVQKGETIAENLKAGFARAARGLPGVIEDGVFNAVTSGKLGQALGDAEGKAYAEEFTKNAVALGNQLLELQSQLADAAAARFEEQAAAFQAQADAAQERIDALTQATQDSAQTILDLEQQMADARGANSDALAAQLDAEANQRSSLQQQIRTQEREKAKFERERLAAEAKAAEVKKRQAILSKVLGIAEAGINTAIGITTVIRDTPKVDFGASAIALIALFSALGAAQIATIAASPIEAADGGLLTEDGGLTKLETGGVVQGPSHAAGGVRGTGAFNNVEVEGGEAVIPRDATERNAEVIHKLLTVGRRQKLADGTAALTALGNGVNALKTPDVLQPRGPSFEPKQIVTPEARDAEAAREQNNRIESLLQKLVDKPNTVAWTDFKEAQSRNEFNDTAGAL